MHTLVRRGTVIAGAVAVLVGSAAGIAMAGSSPRLEWSSAAAGTAGTFGPVLPGSSVTQTLKLTNDGGSATANLKITISGMAFTLLHNTCSGTSLGPGKSCTVTVTYTADSTGGGDTGTLAATGIKAAATATLNLSGVSDVLTVQNPGSQTGTVGDSVDLQMQAHDTAREAVTYSATGLPGGLSISSSGQITGSPNIAGTYNVTVTATDSPTGATGTTSFTWTVNPDVVTVQNPGVQTGTVGDSVDLQMQAYDTASEAVTYSATGLPGGLSISSSGQITGSPNIAGTYNVTVTATDSPTGATGTTSFTWTVNPDVVTVANPGVQTGRVGNSVSLPMTATDTAGEPLTWQATGLPPGATIDPSTGTISSTDLTSAGTYDVTVTATDSPTGATGTTSFTWVVEAPPPTCLITDTNGGATFTNLADAVNAASTDDTLDIAGICTGDASIDGKNLTLNGTTGEATLNGGGAGGVLLVTSSANVTINGLAITGGFNEGGGGGGIDNDGGAVTLNNSVISGNTAYSEGGGIYNDGGTVLLVDSSVTDNAAGGDGGGIDNAGTGTVTFLNSSVTFNIAGSDGGGIYNASTGTVMLNGSSITSNQPDQCGGTAISGCTG